MSVHSCQSHSEMMIQSQFPGKEIQRPVHLRAGREHESSPDHLWTWSRKFPAALLRLSSSWCWNNPRGEELSPAWCLAALSDGFDSEDPANCNVQHTWTLLLASQYTPRPPGAALPTGSSEWELELQRSTCGYNETNHMCRSTKRICKETNRPQDGMLKP